MFNLCFLFVVCSFVLTVTGERGEYVGCFEEDINLHQTLIVSVTEDICLDACERVYFRYAVLLGEKCFCTNVLTARRIEDDICTIRCSKKKTSFCGGVGAQSYFDTNVQVPGPVLNLIQIKPISNTSIRIEWDEPLQMNHLTEYRIHAEPIFTYMKIVSQPLPEWIVQKFETQFELNELRPGSKYNITVISDADADEGGVASVIGETEIGIPDPEPDEPKVITVTENTLTIEISPAQNNNGPVTAYRVVVNIAGSAGVHRNFDESLLKSYDQAQIDGTPYYIAAEIERSETSRRFTVGDSRMYRGFYNAPLPKDHHAHVSIGIVSMANNITRIRYGTASHEQHSSVQEMDAYDEEDSDKTIFMLVIACVIFGVLLVLSIVAYFLLKFKVESNHNRLPVDHHELTLQGPMLEVENNGFIPDDYNRNSFPLKLDGLLQRVDATRKFTRNALNLDVNNIIGNGTFGDVISGNLHITGGDSYHSQVHVISDDMEPMEQTQFLKDFDDLLRVVPHKNLLDFYGVCQTPDWLYLIFENTTQTLKQMLIDSGIAGSFDAKRFSSLTEEHVFEVLLELAETMDYLAQNRIVHKNLCAHNISITANHETKLKLFGPVLYDEDGRQIDMSRWMAPEALKFHHYSTKSDVWSFGCLIWECCCLGATLYQHITNEDMVQSLKNGVRPQQPSFVFTDLYQLMLYCWEIDASERPSFGDICNSLRQLMTAPRHYLSFDRTYLTSMPEYLPLLECKT